MNLIKKIIKFLLRRKSKKIIKDYNQYIEQRQAPPPETIEALKSVYNGEMLDKKLKILNECLDTISKTKNPSIVLDRCEYGLINAYNLRQLEKAGLYNGRPTANEYIDLFKRNKDMRAKECLGSKNNEVQDVYLYRKRTFFTRREEDLSFEFSMKHNELINKMREEFYQVWLDQNINDAAICDKINHYKLALEKLHRIRDFCFNAGRGGKIYYTQNWEELFNSKNPCFSQEDVILEKIDYLQEQKNRLDSFEKISDGIVEIIEQKEEIYQKDLYEIFPDVDKQDIKNMVSELTAKGRITKIRKSNSYELRLKK